MGSTFNPFPLLNVGASPAVVGSLGCENPVIALEIRSDVRDPSIVVGPLDGLELGHGSFYMFYEAGAKVKRSAEVPTLKQPSQR